MSDYRDLLPLYKQRRRTGMAVNNALVKRLSKDILDEGGKRLGILKGKTLLLDSEDELAVLMDFCIHDVRRDGRTTVESFMLEALYAPDSEQMICLNALQQARFSVFVVERVEPGCGVEVKDLRWGGTHFLLDIGLGTTGMPRLVLAARRISFESVSITTGAPLAAGLLPNTWQSSPAQRLLGKLAEQDVKRLSPQQISEENAAILRAFLRAGAAERISYRATDESPDPHPRPTSLQQSGRIGRNDPCPCGSGKKFKKCCGSQK